MDKILDNLVTLNEVILANLPPTLGLPQRPEQQSATKKLQRQAVTTELAVSMAAAEPSSKLQEEVISGQRRYRIEMTKTKDGNWALTLRFDCLHYPNDGNSTVIPHVALFSYPQGQQQLMPFDQVYLESNGVKAVMSISTLEQRDKVYSALSDSSYSTYLVSHFQDQAHQKMYNLLVDPETFYFPLTFYRYIYQDIIPSPLAHPLEQIPLQYDNTWYNYYQDQLNQALFYYLPEEFVIGISPTSSMPMMSLSFSSTDGSGDLQSLRATLSYFLVPVVDKARISNAKQTVESRQNIDNAIFSPLLNPESEVLSIELPAPQGLTQETNALIDIQGGIHDKFTLTIPEFQKIWDALFSSSQANLLFRGQLAVTVKGFASNNITVTPRLTGDKKQIMKAIIDSSQQTTYEKTLTVMTVASTFNSKGDKTIELILIDVGGQTVAITADNLSQKVKVKLPIIDTLNGQQSDTQYHFDQKIIYKNAPQKVDKGLKTSMEIIYVPATT